MASPAFTVRHLGTRSELPETLTQGRVYFIDDEGSLVINHGNGPVEYGARSLTLENAEEIAKIITDRGRVPNFYKRMSQYRGKNLGETMTPEQYDDIVSGKFENTYLGDYWEREMTYEDYQGNQVTNTLRWRIMHFTGNNRDSLRWDIKNVVIWLDNGILFPIPFWDDASKGKNYGGSVMYQQGYEPALQITRDFFSQITIPDRTGLMPDASVPASDAKFFGRNNNTKATIRPPYLQQVCFKDVPGTINMYTTSFNQTNAFAGEVTTFSFHSHWQALRFADNSTPGGSAFGAISSMYWTATPYQGGKYAVGMFGTTPILKSNTGDKDWNIQVPCIGWAPYFVIPVEAATLPA